jgi:hypothetical protein
VQVGNGVSQLGTWGAVRRAGLGDPTLSGWPVAVLVATVEIDPAL